MKLRNVTPESHLCSMGACPAIYETDQETYLIVGVKVPFIDDVLKGKVGPDEAVVEVPEGLLGDLVKCSGKGADETCEMVSGGTSPIP